MSTPVTIIEPRKGWMPIDYREMWHVRELLFFLTWRDRMTPGQSMAANAMGTINQLS